MPVRIPRFNESLPLYNRAVRETISTGARYSSGIKKNPMNLKKHA